MAFPHQSCADVSETVAMAFRAKAVRMYRDGSYGFAVPELCGRIETVAMAVPRQSCADVSRGQTGGRG